MSMEVAVTLLVSVTTGVVIAIILAAWSSYKSFSSTTPKSKPEKNSLDIPTYLRRGIKINID